MTSSVSVVSPDSAAELSSSLSIRISLLHHSDLFYEENRNIEK